MTRFYHAICMDLYRLQDYEITNSLLLAYTQVHRIVTIKFWTNTTQTKHKKHTLTQNNDSGLSKYNP